MSKQTKEPPLATAKLRHTRISPQKARLVLGLIRGKQIEPAMNILAFNRTKGAKLMHKLLQSAVANAQEKGGIDVDDLWVTGGYVDMGKVMKRFIPRAQGRATPIRKPSSHITIELGTQDSSSTGKGAGRGA